MPGVRRVVTGTDATGRSVVVEDGITPRAHDFATIPGMSTALVWAATDGMPWHVDQPDPTLGVDPDEPAAGEVRFLVIRFPPDAVLTRPGFDPAAADEEQRLVSPRLHARFNADRGGMHTTETTDYVTVVRVRSTPSWTTASWCRSAPETPWYRTAPGTAGATSATGKP
jgi:hypothetical protein